MSKPPKPAPDWERIEGDFRAGVLSLREIAARNAGVSHVSIKKHADKAGWTRDLSAKIKAKADDLVNKAPVNSAVNSTATVNEREVIEVNALAIATVRLGHRGDIRRSRNLGLELLAELEMQTNGLEVFEELAELMYAPDKAGRDRLNEIYHRVINTSGRVSNFKALSDALKNLIGLEREAWGLDEPEKPAGDLKELSDDELDERIRAHESRLSAQRER